MWERQRALATVRERDELGNLLLLLEHEHVYTNGRSGDRAHLLADAATLARLGATYQEIDRGGDITYHGPGQLVGYPIIGIDQLGLGVRTYVRGLEAALIQTAAHFGVAATTIPGYTGVWVGADKLAAIGVKVGRGVAYHGFALNVDPDLSYFDHIVPCGIPDRGVTSLARLLGRAVAVDEVVSVCAEAFAAVFGLDVRWVSPGQIDWGAAAGGKGDREVPRLRSGDGQETGGNAARRGGARGSRRLLEPRTPILELRTSASARRGGHDNG
jgi:lipoate-protein ligase B